MTRPTLITDWQGVTWEVSETRASGHGWIIYRGRPYPRPRARGSAGGNRIVMTPELLAYLRGHAPKDYRLPISRNALKRLRAEADLHAVYERDAWWLERLDDLGAMTGREFAAAHPAPARTGEERLVILQESTISVQRQRLLGRALRPVGWWRAPNVAAILTSGLPTSEIAAQLDIAEGSVRRLRWMLTPPR